MKLHYTGFMSGNSKRIADKLDWRKDGSDCESITDKSSFIPNKELMRKAQSGGVVASQVVYDFEDGKDTGMKVPVARIKGADIAEISQEIKKEGKKLKDAQAQAEAEQKAAEEAQARLNAIKEAANTPAE